eukprot:270357-Prymnesium_polylepis.1
MLRRRAGGAGARTARAPTFARADIAQHRWRSRAARRIASAVRVCDGSFAVVLGGSWGFSVRRYGKGWGGDFEKSQSR